jgi:outer membrane lipoprotein-sorting protein
MAVGLDDATGATLTAKFTNAAGETALNIAAAEIKANTGLDKKLFAYTPPEGAKVVDTTQPAQEPAP